MNERSAPLSPFVAWPEGFVLVLASRSPRRAELLQVAGIPFEVRLSADVEASLAAELSVLHDDPPAYATALAAAKAASVAERMPDRLVLGADTIVILDGDILEKPVDAAEACALLQRLQGRRHTVVSSICLRGGPAGPTGVDAWERTEVEFLPLGPEMIRRYVATGEPMDKAGAYGIQGYGALMVKEVRGCYFNVMGLPLARLGGLLREVLGR